MPEVSRPDSTLPEASLHAPPAPPLGVRALLLLALTGMTLGWLLVLVQPGLLGMPPGHPTLPVLVHLFTLGAVLPLYLALQHRLWSALYAPRGGTWPLTAIGALHATGVALFTGGLWASAPRLANLGGHYVVPSALVLFLLWGAQMTWRRAPGRARHLGAHLPGLGLALAAGLGAFLILDRSSGGSWGIYTLDSIAVHALSAAMLFLWPLLTWLRRGWTVPDDASDPDLQGVPDPAPLFRPVTVAALGVLLVAVGTQGRFGAHAPQLGLSLLGALAVWEGWQKRTMVPPPVWQRLASTLRLFFGALLVFMAIRLLRGAPLPGALPALAALLFLSGLALPELLLAAWGLPQRGKLTITRQVRWALGLQYVGSLALLGMLLGSLPLDPQDRLDWPWLGQLGALAQLAAVLAWSNVFFGNAPTDAGAQTQPGR